MENGTSELHDTEAALLHYVSQCHIIILDHHSGPKFLHLQTTMPELTPQGRSSKALFQQGQYDVAALSSSFSKNC